MFQFLILFLLQSPFKDASATLFGLNKVPFDGPARGPEIKGEGVDSIASVRQQNKHAEKAKEYYVEKINHVQDSIAMRWPLGIVPYYFDMMSYDYVLNSRTRDAMDAIESASCVRFKATILKPDNYSWIHITNPDHVRDCIHEPIIKGYEIRLPLGLDCLRRRDLIHTLLHAIGFKDEVSHPQRDQYIRIMWDNIQPQYKTLFRLQPDEGPTKSLAEYDPMSIMHFHDRAFSKNGQATIAGLMPGLQINPGEVLSQLDRMKLRLLFGHECNRRKVDDLLDTCKKTFHTQYGGAVTGRAASSETDECKHKNHSKDKNASHEQQAEGRQDENEDEEELAEKDVPGEDTLSKIADKNLALKKKYKKAPKLDSTNDKKNRLDAVNSDFWFKLAKDDPRQTG